MPFRTLKPSSFNLKSFFILTDPSVLFSPDLCCLLSSLRGREQTSPASGWAVPRQEARQQVLTPPFPLLSFHFIPERRAIRRQP